ncbi:proline-rich transmembrane protein 1-like isoform X2 [Epinephelus moara]|uniref:proline-rich transmembrane protein 1-like isoform X2 n=1 Tax=Epinephelus moara TaxID=300413 RepID=UPI00214F3526|nr:proline-rich transmembrane protein 1-like isoform X2 [Epinephelus moara]
MDPSKSASAPPAGWADEKSSMAHAPPPPYNDQPYPGYPQPGPGYPGYPPQQQGYVPPPQYGGAPYGQHPGQPNAVTVQPTVFVTQGPLTNPVNDYLCYSIFTMLCCCLPVGVAALIYSISAREANHVGDRMGAERSSRMARTLNHVALGIGIGLLVLTIVYVAVMSSMFN